jgi:hypothetical protein
MQPISIVSLVTLFACTNLPAQRVIASTAGTNSADLHGYSIAVLGDVDSDGVVDYAVGIPGEDYTAGFQDRGMVKVISGRANRVLHFIPGPRAWMRLGTCVAAIGDIDADGVPDFAAGAPEDNGARGFVTVRSGRTGAELLALTGEASSGYGTTIAPISDVNGDGRRDLVVGAPRHRGGTNGGFVRVHAMPSGATIQSYGLLNDSGFFGFAAAMAHIGDMDGNGSDEIAVGVPGYSVGMGNRGAIAVMTPDGAGGLRGLTSWVGAAAGDMLGSAVTGVDIDQDNRPELLVGAPSNVGAGRAFIFKPGIGAPLHTFTGVAGDNFGLACGKVGDMNGDGRVDFAVGAPDDAGGRGRVRVIDGATFTTMFEIAGNPGERLGYGVTEFSDIDGDGRSNALVSRPWADAPAADSGAVDVVIFAPAGSSTRFGVACAGLFGAPSLSGSSNPAVGLPMRLEARNLRANAVGALLVGASRTVWNSVPLPVDLTLFGFLGCQLHISPDVFLPAQAQGFPNPGIATIFLNIPPVFSLVGQHLFFQYLSVDQTLSPLTFSNGVDVQIGS